VTPSFGERLAGAFDTFGQLCVGIDPHSFLLEEWGLPNSATGLREFGLRVVDAAAGNVGIVKPQIAFFERHGSDGYRALEEVLAAARAAGLLVIADVKRGDVGSTVEAYAQAWLTPGGALEADAITMSAYQGVESLHAPVDLALASAKGIFVLAATSNPESFALQRSILSGGPFAGATVAGSIVDAVSAINRQHFSTGLGSVGVVLGATVHLGDYGIELERISGAAATPILAPGFGHQGASVSDIGTLFGVASSQVIVTASRSILSAGPAVLAGSIRSHAHEVAQWRG
jgi:orotidine-5'-phosphate decarboxylase